ncbi:chlorite dismutase family protein [Brooklawnia cerclae]|uniref:Coproheme decarboxylase n=1 Tax=Brooklawnia cerclae TaxID=349934 RepID=A0ABX0SDX5_9ACTN|nr:hydrogen peroxide-dependent heme synthase [Brooklawnia cerclae]NIH55523.1 chlorite dismutase [Brooklawnia cerclae]
MPNLTEEINASIHYTCWAVYARTGSGEATLDGFAEQVADDGIVVRGYYDLSAMRADADLMVWFHGPDPVALQAAARVLRRRLEPAGRPVWSGVGIHRPAEFNRRHVPAFLTGRKPEAWLTVYPFVRSLDWYLLPEDERGAMLREHGEMGRAYPQVIANTVSAFALGDYEWIIALESAELHDLVDLMRHLRYAEARRHVRLEVPFYTGRRIGASEAGELLR